MNMEKIQLANFFGKIEEVPILDTFWLYGQHFSIVNLIGTSYHKRKTNCYTAVYTKTGRITIQIESSWETYSLEMLSDILISLKAKSTANGVKGVVSFIEKTKHIPIIEKNMELVK